MRHAALLLCLAVAGCSSSEATPTPATPSRAEKPAAKFPRLEVGSAGMISGEDFVIVQHPDGREWHRGEPEAVDCFVREGDRLTILDDSRPEIAEDRTVRVKVETGQRIGGPYLVPRRVVRPLSTPRP